MCALARRPARPAQGLQNSAVRNFGSAAQEPEHQINHNCEARQHDADGPLSLRVARTVPRADAIVAAVAHREYFELSLEDISRKVVKNGAFIDVKAAFDAKALEGAGYRVWRL